MINSQKARILIVDDDAANIESLNNGLGIDYQISFANSGRMAMQLATKQTPDLILIDTVLPDMVGFELCRFLKNQMQTKHIPIIFITSDYDVDQEIQGLQLGAVDYFKKPLKMPLLCVRVHNQIQLKKKTDLLEQLVSLDGLTHIPNRRQFDTSFDVEWRRAQRKQTSITLLMIDIDFFKQYNDHYGHAQGDKCLVKVAKELAHQAQRAGDFVARYGGEEFALIIPDSNIEHGQAMAEILRRSIEHLAIEHGYSSCNHFVTVSVGCASVLPSSAMHKESLLQASDEQLYAAKESGRNKVCAISL